MKRLNQSGSHVLVLALGLVVVGVIAFAGYTVMNSKNTGTTTASTTQKSDVSSINNAADLSTAAKQLDSSSSQVDSSLNDSSLDSDLNDLL
jgi:hypothetical protein